MPELRPFQGIRYSPDLAISELVCPPYDVISSEQQQQLHDRHPNNAIRLELATPGPGANKYEGVGRTFTSWIETGVLGPDPDPSLYVYRQDFTDPNGSRRRVAGVLGALALEEFGDSSGVLPHERTMAGPKEDRLQLMRACPVNISPIYAIYRGAGAVRSLLDALEERAPAARFQGDDGILHRLWRVDAEAELVTIANAVQPGPLVIADGHHRYETALAFHRERLDAPEEPDRERGKAPGDHGSIMCFCVDADSEELVVLPYNRAFQVGIDLDEARSALDKEFPPSNVDHPFTILIGDEEIRAGVSDEQVVEAVGPRHPAWRDLDVVALHEVLIPRAFGEVTGMTFSRDPDEIARLLKEGTYNVGVLLRALTAAQIVDVAGSGERMPQKASYFWPKAITGLVFHSLD